MFFFRGFNPIKFFFSRGSEPDAFYLVGSDPDAFYLVGSDPDPVNVSIRIRHSREDGNGLKVTLMRNLRVCESALLY